MQFYSPLLIIYIIPPHTIIPLLIIIFSPCSGMNTDPSKRHRTTTNTATNPSPFTVPNNSSFQPSPFATQNLVNNAPCTNTTQSFPFLATSNPLINTPTENSPIQAQLALLQALTRISGNNNNSNKKNKNKRKKKKSKKSDSSDSSSSPDSLSSGAESSSSDQEPSSNWSLLKNVWPVEKRPLGLQNKLAVNSIDLNNLLSIAKLDRENLKALDGDLSSSFNPDKKPKSTTFKKQKDDGFKHLHLARFQRLPLAKMEKWWKLVPRVRTHQYKNLELKFSGCNNKLTQKTIQSLHDRTKVLQFKHFHAANVNVSAKPVKKIEKREEEGIVSTLDFAWENPTTIAQVADTLLNYSTALFQLWPYDPTGLILMRVVNKFNYASAAPTVSERVSVITAFFNLVLRENATRAVRKDLILDFDEQVDCFKNILSTSGYSSAVPSSYRIPKADSDRFKPKFTPMPPRSTSNFSLPKQKANVVLHNGVAICFNYNTGSCRNPSSTVGCRDSKAGKDYAHVCNKWIQAKNSHCFQRHSRFSSH